jgi:hypothetical protein
MLPCTTVSNEYSFSSLTKIKDHKHNSMKNYRLTGLASVVTEKRLLNALESHENFYDLAIEEVVKKERRIDFTYNERSVLFIRLL